MPEAEKLAEFFRERGIYQGRAQARDFERHVVEEAAIPRNVLRLSSVPLLGNAPA